MNLNMYENLNLFFIHQKEFHEIDEKSEIHETLSKKLGEEFFTFLYTNRGMDYRRLMSSLLPSELIL